MQDLATCSSRIPHGSGPPVEDLLHSPLLHRYFVYRIPMEKFLHYNWENMDMLLSLHIDPARTVARPTWRSGSESRIELEGELVIFIFQYASGRYASKWKVYTNWRYTLYTAR